eukprot:5782782-Prymnesium_polylepis.1
MWHAKKGRGHACRDRAPSRHALRAAPRCIAASAPSPPPPRSPTIARAPPAASLPRTAQHL